MAMTQRHEQNWVFLSKMLLMKSDRPPYAHKHLDKSAEVFGFLSVYIPCLRLHTNTHTQTQCETGPCATVLS